MLAQSRARGLRCVGFALGALALLPAARAAAQTSAPVRKVPVESLVYDLKNPDPVRRQIAARELGAIKYQAATPDLVAMAHDPVDAVRREVELTLERMEDMRALPGFVAFAGDAENDIRSRAVASLVNIHLSRENLLSQALTKITVMMMLAPDRDLEVIVEPDIPVDPIVVETLRGRMSDAERGIRRTAIRGLGILRAKAAVPDLLRVVREDRDEGLRFDGVRALRKIGDASIAADLLALVNINNDTVRNELMATLGAMRYRGAVAELTRIVDQAPKTDTPRIVALAALADIADPASVELFDRFKSDKSEPLRLFANEGIARTADANRKADISAARLVEKSARVRTAQAFALLRIGESEYMDELIRALDRAATRDLAKEYLIETRPEDRAALFNPQPFNTGIRVELADVLGRIGDPAALPRLQEMAQDSNGDVARAAERATRRLGVTNADVRSQSSTKMR
jgi:HEAT repeat protein